MPGTVSWLQVGIGTPASGAIPGSRVTGCCGVPSDGASIRHGTSSTEGPSSTVVARTVAAAMRNSGEEAFLVEEHTPWVEVVAAVKQN